MSIRIITHCWARDLPQYAQFLRYHVSSLVLYPPDFQVGVTVCYCKDDINTVKALRDLICHMSIAELNLRGVALQKDELGRRSIGRNKAALLSTEDLIWFADVDYVFRQGCLQSLYQQWLQLKDTGISMLYPNGVKIHKDHETGDKAVQWAANCKERWIDIDPADFIPWKYRKAIGGAQIVSGEFARQHGYLKDNEMWQTPRTDGVMFGHTRDDIAYRTYCKEYGKIVPIELPELYRLRHTRKTY